jgi:hypothetical protein|tara:strand:+ start:1769 stop:2008 length:240 start_codon:yes stop_codon:yes gene_type:complete
MIVKRITESSVYIDGEVLFLRNDGLYGTREQRAVSGVVEAVLKLLMAEVSTEEGIYVKQINKLLKQNKIIGAIGICLEL